MSGEANKIVFEATIFDEGDYIVCLRPASARPWQTAIVGPCIDKAKAQIVAKWLQEAWPELLKVMAKATEAES